MPALDGVRGLAILLVVAAHVSHDLVPLGGAVGVTLFFVLSGFLITRLLLRDIDRRYGRLRLRVFYTRRAARLLPALLVVLVAAPLLMWVAGDPRLGQFPRDAAAIITYVGNYALIFLPGDLGPLSHTWSLSVEEQFYVGWPLLLVLLVRRSSNLPRVLWLLAGAAAVWRVAAAILLGYDWSYWALDTNAFALLMGAAFAAQQRQGGVSPVLGRVLVVPSLLGVVAFAVLARGDVYLMVSVGAPLFGLLGLGVVAGAATWGSRLLTARPMVWFGSVSYGWYLWHQLLISLEVDGARVGLAGRVVFAVVALGLAWLSLRFVERPVLQRHSRRGAVRAAARERVAVTV